MGCVNRRELRLKLCCDDVPCPKSVIVWKKLQARRYIMQFALFCDHRNEPQNPGETGIGLYECHTTDTVTKLAPELK